MRWRCGQRFNQLRFGKADGVRQDGTALAWHTGAILMLIFGSGHRTGQGFVGLVNGGAPGGTALRNCGCVWPSCRLVNSTPPSSKGLKKVFIKIRPFPLELYRPVSHYLSNLTLWPQFHNQDRFVEYPHLVGIFWCIFTDVIDEAQLPVDLFYNRFCFWSCF